MIPYECPKVIKLVDKIQDLCESYRVQDWSLHELVFDCKTDFEKIVDRQPMRYVCERNVIDFNCSKTKYYRMDDVKKSGFSRPIFIKIYVRLENILYLKCFKYF